MQKNTEGEDISILTIYRPAFEAAINQLPRRVFVKEDFGMQRSKSNEIAREIIRIDKEILGEKIENIALFNVTDEPYKMFSIKCTIYNYFVLVFNYDRGHFGCNIVCGNDAIALTNTIEWDDGCDFTVFWKEIDEQVRLRIPDKYLQAYGWL